jgi:shikimate kinase
VLGSLAAGAQSIDEALRIQLPQVAARPRRREKDMSLAKLAVPKTIVLVGLMGAGKSCVGRRLATVLGLPFCDADKEIEEAAGCSIPELFSRYGEAAFRDGERRVIHRLLEGPKHVLATGGGAFMDERTRAEIRENGISVWLRADLDLLVRRTQRRGNRPLLNVPDPAAKLAELIAQRYPVYAQADVTVDSDDSPPEVTVERVISALQRHIERPAARGTAA